MTRDPDFDRLVLEIAERALDALPDARAAYLEEACASPHIRERVEELLVRFDQAPLPDPPNMNARLSVRDADPLIGSEIGPYRILDCLGEGGMGVVYRAQQARPLHRTVALKIVKLGMNTREVAKRFEQEREALAVMNHPNVARVFDAGSTEQGRPYFVMEYVPGVSITEYCDTNKLTTDDRLRLCVDVCAGIQHAHQKGIIHRDIKPSNILIALQDGKAVPKVIDFGVAKATQNQFSERTLFTAHGQLIGTPAYMSPEQAEMTRLDVDTRTDIYSLGVLIYQLVVGALPFDTETFRDAGLLEIQRIIREVDPPKPSSRLAALSLRPDSAHRQRGIDSQTLSRRLRGDLDWIIMKCLEKDRARRYETANGLAMEIRRHLNHEPVLAGPPGARYRFTKFMRRNRKDVMFATATVALVAIGAVLLVAVNRKLNAKEIERMTSRGITLADGAHWMEAESVFREILRISPSSADAWSNLGRMRLMQYNTLKDVSRRDLLAEALGYAERAREHDPENKGVWNVIGVASKKLGRLKKALDAYDHILMQDSESYFALTNKGTILALMYRLDEAGEFLRRATEVPQNCPRSVDTWRNWAAFQFAWGEKDSALASLDRAEKCRKDDVGTSIHKARYFLGINLKRATDALAIAKHNSAGEPASAKLLRLDSQLALCRGEVSEAVQLARSAIRAGDLPVFGQLVLAVALARLRDVEGARQALDDARNNSPAEFRERDGYISSADEGLLWFDSAAEIHQLERAAEESIRLLEHASNSDSAIPNSCPWTDR